MKMNSQPPDQDRIARVREYLRTWQDEDWDDLDRLSAVMPLGDALIEVHRSKLRAITDGLAVPIELFGSAVVAAKEQRSLSF